MRKVAITLMSVCFAVSILAGCGEREDPERADISEEIVARVGNKEITGLQLREAVHRYSSSLIQRGQQPPPDIENTILRLLIESELLYQAGSRILIPDLENEVERQYRQIAGQFPSVEAMEEVLGQQRMTPEMLRDDIRRELTVGHVIQTQIYDRIEVTEEEIEDFYEENREQLQRPELLKISHILVAVEPPADDDERAVAREKIASIRTRIEEGEDFEDLAAEYSGCPSGAAGGDLGMVSRGQTDADFEEAAWNLEVGELSEPVETAFGFHLIRVEERKEEGIPTLEEAREELRDFIIGRKAPEKIQEYINTLRREIEVETYFSG